MEYNVCTRCGSCREWVDCPDCQGEGGRFEYDINENRIWIECDVCVAEGGWYTCAACEGNREADTVEFVSE